MSNLATSFLPDAKCQIFVITDRSFAKKKGTSIFFRFCFQVLDELTGRVLGGPGRMATFLGWDRMRRSDSGVHPLRRSPSSIRQHRSSSLPDFIAIPYLAPAAAALPTASFHRIPSPSRPPHPHPHPGDVALLLLTPSTAATLDIAALPPPS